MMSMNFKDSLLSIVLPTYNERENLPSITDEIASLLKRIVKYEIIIVDDNSPDGTGRIADELSKNNGNVKVVYRPGKMGLSSALIDGIKVANGDIVVVLDSDLQHPPKLLHTLLDEIANGGDLVIASRYVNGGCINRWTKWRKIVSKCATLFVHVSLPNIKGVKDPLSGYFVFRRSFVDGMRLRGMGCKLLLEILAKGKWKRIVEVPYMFESRQRGKSKLKFKDYADFVKLILYLARSKE